MAGGARGGAEGGTDGGKPGGAEGGMEGGAKGGMEGGIAGGVEGGIDGSVAVADGENIRTIIMVAAIWGPQKSSLTGFVISPHLAERLRRSLLLSALQHVEVPQLGQRLRPTSACSCQVVTASVEAVHTPV